MHDESPLLGSAVRSNGRRGRIVEVNGLWAKIGWEEVGQILPREEAYDLLLDHQIEILTDTGWTGLECLFDQPESRTHARSYSQVLEDMDDLKPDEVEESDLVAATNAAHEASMKADTSGTSASHLVAAKTHRSAYDAHKKAGNDDVAKSHLTQASNHLKAGNNGTKQADKSSGWADWRAKQESIDEAAGTKAHSSFKTAAKTFMGPRSGWFHKFPGRTKGKHMARHKKKDIWDCSSEGTYKQVCVAQKDVPEQGITKGTIKHVSQPADSKHKYNKEYKAFVAASHAKASRSKLLKHMKKIDKLKAAAKK